MECNKILKKEFEVCALLHALVDLLVSLQIAQSFMMQQHIEKVAAKHFVFQVLKWRLLLDVTFEVWCVYLCVSL